MGLLYAADLLGVALFQIAHRAAPAASMAPRR